MRCAPHRHCQGGLTASHRLSTCALRASHSLAALHSRLRVPDLAAVRRRPAAAGVARPQGPRCGPLAV